jgi:sugar/nucleoside kinase (ribokinase family)
VDHHHLIAATEVAHYARSKGLPVVADIERVQPGDEEFIAAVDIPILPRSFVRALSGQQDLEAGARYVQSLGPQTVVITCGDEGVLAFDGDTRLQQPAFCVGPIVDTTGAGDVFHGAFAYGVALGLDLERNLAFAGAAAALSCQALGGRGSLPTMAQVEQLLG